MAINNNIREWRDAFTPSADRPRLPLPYVFGAATRQAGFRLSAIERVQSPAHAHNSWPFEAVFQPEELARALEETDYALLSGRQGLSVLARQSIRPRSRRQVLLFSYAWNAPDGSLQRRGRLAVIRRAARRARGVVLMTGEQVNAARTGLPKHVPVVGVTVGVDCGFYAGPASLCDIPEADCGRVARILESPYVVMPGDELRLNDHALAVVEESDLNLVRISQYGSRSGIVQLKAQIARRALGDRLHVFERISYPALRFLMRHATACAGLVDSIWQPAGWTVACECLASGLPIVIYEGLVSRELRRLGASPEILVGVPHGDVTAFGAALRHVAEAKGRAERRAAARAFAERNLNLERTGAAFGEALRHVVSAG